MGHRGYPIPIVPNWGGLPERIHLIGWRLFAASPLRVTIPSDEPDLIRGWARLIASDSRGPTT